ncbi:hypothetical protein C8R44DRAFT_855585 [Mycena epipterygia]|nr:hypothetical protein C8R44DRAFT_855585 [Mycena epipterygia]
MPPQVGEGARCGDDGERRAGTGWAREKGKETGVCIADTRGARQRARVENDAGGDDDEAVEGGVEDETREGGAAPARRENGWRGRIAAGGDTDASARRRRIRLCVSDIPQLNRPHDPVLPVTCLRSHPPPTCTCRSPPPLGVVSVPVLECWGRRPRCGTRLGVVSGVDVEYHGQSAVPLIVRVVPAVEESRLSSGCQRGHSLPHPPPAVAATWLYRVVAGGAQVANDAGGARVRGAGEATAGDNDKEVRARPWEQADAKDERLGVEDAEWRSGQALALGVGTRGACSELRKGTKMKGGAKRERSQSKGRRRAMRTQDVARKTSRKGHEGCEATYSPTEQRWQQSSSCWGWSGLRFRDAGVRRGPDSQCFATSSSGARASTGRPAHRRAQAASACSARPTGAAHQPAGEQPKTAAGDCRGLQRTSYVWCWSGEEEQPELGAERVVSLPSASINHCMSEVRCMAGSLGVGNAGKHTAINSGGTAGTTVGV